MKQTKEKKKMKEENGETISDLNEQQRETQRAEQPTNSHRCESYQQKRVQDDQVLCRLTQELRNRPEIV